MKTNLLLILSALLCFTRLEADTLRESYTAVLSDNDHYNSNGERLKNAAAIIRQDRANFHKLGHRDPGDDSDQFFANAKNREILEQFLNRGTSSPAALRAIVNSTPTVNVRIYQTNEGQDYVNVTIIVNRGEKNGGEEASELEEQPGDDPLIESYTAVLSDNDHYNSNGERLKNAAAIIRQDRANFHKLGHRDPGDDSDQFFANAKNREILEQLLNRGKSTSAALRAIINGTPSVTVSIFRTASGQNYVNVVVRQ